MPLVESVKGISRDEMRGEGQVLQPGKQSGLKRWVHDCYLRGIINSRTQRRINALSHWMICSSSRPQQTIPNNASDSWQGVGHSRYSLPSPSHLPPTWQGKTPSACSASKHIAENDSSTSTRSPIRYTTALCRMNSGPPTHATQSARLYHTPDSKLPSFEILAPEHELSR
ncbi:hypothetical protein O181_001594 [Austropuccinia psidii MF-1]|uniref:Uncharacterized protein n=1 Tax=Austropuccinia psidii MF-1 TaxID=1389203 RepID=A0A9Q3BAU0_9BASI|nr:hypothetical protein [Austropuccinia psidii MF-1]